MQTKTLGEYVVGELLGTGTVGTVYRATHQETGAEVALKVLIPGAARTEGIQKRFAREIAVVQKLNHPHIIQHFSNGNENGVLYYTMELARYGSLDEVLTERRTLPWQETAECGVQIASALHVLHAHGIIHRDLKPANIYLAEDGKLKLGDFGLARDALASKLTLDGQTVGTIRYMAPEQIRGRQDIDGRLDLYALGCILFRCAAGRLPIDGANPLETFEGHLHKVPPRLDTIIASCPASFAIVIAKLLEKDPAKRPANGHVVARVLSQVLANPDIPITDEDFLPIENEADSQQVERTTDLAGRLKAGIVAAPKDIAWKNLAIVLAVAAVGVLVLLLTRRM